MWNIGATIKYVLLYITMFKFPVLAASIILSEVRTWP